MSLVKNLPTRWGKLGRKTGQEINQWKNLLTWTKDREEKTENDGEISRLMERRGVCSRKDLIERRDLDDKGLGQKKVLCSFSGVELPWSTTMQAPRHSLCQGDRSPATRRLLTFRTALTQIPSCRLFFVASSLSTHLACLPRLGALCSASCQSFLFPLERLGGLDCWSSHRWCGVDCKRSCRWLVRVVLVERTDEHSKVLDCWGWLPGVFFLWIPFLRHQVIEAW